MRIVLAALIGVILAGPVAAQECIPYEAIADGLTKDFGEVRLLQGLSAQGWIMELWTNPQSGSWSIVLQGPNGCGHIADGGDNISLLSVKMGTES